MKTEALLASAASTTRLVSFAMSPPPTRVSPPCQHRSAGSCRQMSDRVGSESRKTAEFCADMRCLSAAVRAGHRTPVAEIGFQINAKPAYVQNAKGRGTPSRLRGGPLAGELPCD
jgi:hypothetical protein